MGVIRYICLSCPYDPTALALSHLLRGCFFANKIPGPKPPFFFLQKKLSLPALKEKVILHCSLVFENSPLVYKETDQGLIVLQGWILGWFTICNYIIIDEAFNFKTNWKLGKGILGLCITIELLMLSPSVEEDDDLPKWNRLWILMNLNNHVLNF